jgi:aquaporin Z
MFNWKVFAAEFIGTFTFVFVGSAAGIYTDNLLTVALAHGFALAAVAYVYGHISGAHVNPAVTLGMAANKSITWGEAVVYWLAQFIAAAVAAFLLRAFLSPIPEASFDKAATSGFLVSRTTISVFYGLSVELLLTFFLMSAILHTAVDGKAGQFAGLAIGLTLMVGVIAGGPLTGGSMNPARSFGPALFAQTIATGIYDFQMLRFYIIYLIGPCLGSLLAVAVHSYMRVDASGESGMEKVGEHEPVNPFMRKPTVRKGRK